MFILDGFEVDVQKIYDLDVNRIESITILKDAAATAMYGSQAANGVVVVLQLLLNQERCRFIITFPVMWISRTCLIIIFVMRLKNWS